MPCGWTFWRIRAARDMMDDMGSAYAEFEPTHPNSDYFLIIS